MTPIDAGTSGCGDPKRAAHRRSKRAWWPVRLDSEARVQTPIAVLNVVKPCIETSQGDDESEVWFTPCRFGVMLALLIFAVWFDVLVGWSSFFYRDFGVWAYPNAHYHRESFWRGEVPLWNPLSNCGLPFLAQWNTLTLYPFSLIYVLLPLPWSLGVFCLAHLWLAGVGMYLLARTWVGGRFAASVAGLVYALNGLVLHSLMWPNNIAALSWMPLVILAVWRACQKGRRAVAPAAVVGATQMLAGAPEIILLTWFIVGILLLGAALQGKKPRTGSASCFAGILALVALLCAVQLLPFLDLLGRSQRSTGFAANVWSMPAWGWANYLVPLFHQTKSVVGVYSQTDQQWTSSYYAGIGVTALSLLAVLLRVRGEKVALLAGLGIFGVLMAMGESGFLYPGLRRVLPQVGLARFPVKFVVLATFVAPLLAAYGVHRVMSSNLSFGRAAWWIGAVWLSILVLIVGLIWVAHASPVDGEEWLVTLQSGASRAVFLSLILATVLALKRVRRPKARRAGSLVVLLLIVADALTHAPRQNPMIAAEALTPSASGLSRMPAPDEARVMITPMVQSYMDHAATANLLQYYLGQRRVLFGNCNLIDGVSKLNGIYSLHLREQAEVSSLVYSYSNQFPAGLADFLGVTLITSDDKVFDWVRRTGAFPMMTAGQRPLFNDAPGTIAALADPHFNGREVVYLPLEMSGSVNAVGQPNVHVEMNSFAARRIEATVEAGQPALVVVSQAYHPFWKAFVNGRRALIWRANHAFQALEVPAGRSRLRLIYQDRLFGLGMAISLAAFLICLALRRGGLSFPGANAPRQSGPVRGQTE